MTWMRLNPLNIKRVDTDDPVAKKVSWNALKKGGSNFKTQSISVSTNKARIKASFRMKLFFAVFWLVGFEIFYSGTQSEMANGVLIFLGSFFIAIGLGGTFFFSRKLTFDKSKGVYFRGQYEHCVAPASREKQGNLTDIYALQIVGEMIQDCVSYELNLVFENGERINVMDHGNADSLGDSAMRLAEFLDVPLWRWSDYHYVSVID